MRDAQRRGCVTRQDVDRRTASCSFAACSSSARKCPSLSCSSRSRCRSAASLASCAAIWSARTRRSSRSSRDPASAPRLSNKRPNARISAAPRLCSQAMTGFGGPCGCSSATPSAIGSLNAPSWPRTPADGCCNRIKPPSTTCASSTATMRRSSPDEHSAVTWTKSCLPGVQVLNRAASKRVKATPRSPLTACCSTGGDKPRPSSTTATLRQPRWPFSQCRKGSSPYPQPGPARPGSLMSHRMAAGNGSNITGRLACTDLGGSL